MIKLKIFFYFFDVNVVDLVWLHEWRLMIVDGSQATPVHPIISSDSPWLSEKANHGGGIAIIPCLIKQALIVISLAVIIMLGLFLASTITHCNNDNEQLIQIF